MVSCDASEIDAQVKKLTEPCQDPRLRDYPNRFVAMTVDLEDGRFFLFWFFVLGGRGGRNEEEKGERGEREEGRKGEREKGRKWEERRKGENGRGRKREKEGKRKGKGKGEVKRERKEKREKKEKNRLR